MSSLWRRGDLLPLRNQRAITRDMFGPNTCAATTPVRTWKTSHPAAILGFSWASAGPTKGCTRRGQYILTGLRAGKSNPTSRSTSIKFTAAVVPRHDQIRAPTAGEPWSLCDLGRELYDLISSDL